jgi:hypothetical protein
VTLNERCKRIANGDGRWLDRPQARYSGSIPILDGSSRFHYSPGEARQVMTENNIPGKTNADADLEREIREGRKFSAQEAVARLAGPGAMKGASPVSPQLQAENAIQSWLAGNAEDVPGALTRVLHRHLKGSQCLLDNIHEPLIALAQHCERLLGSDELLEETVRQADVEWGKAMDERPHFERPGGPIHPDDPYTVRSVRNALTAIVARLS